MQTKRPTNSPRIRPDSSGGAREWLGPTVMLLVAVVLLSGLMGGLLRAGVPLPKLQQSHWASQATGFHAALMICGFLGTVIGIERAVALRAAWSFSAPLMSLAGALCILNGLTDWGAGLFVLASCVFVAVNIVIVLRQSAQHTWLLLLSALIWLGSNVLFVVRHIDNSTLMAWFGFLILTIAAERLEMSRLMPKQPAAKPLLMLILSMLLGGIVLSVWQTMTGGMLYGVALCGLALWLGVFDIARKTVRAKGLARYMAICLLTGYAWLGVAGLGWAAYAAGWPSRDVAMHALGLGFIISMVMGHAPVILPAVAGIKLHFDHRFYAPLAALHLSLILRLLGTTSPTLHAWGSALNAVTILLFALTVISSALSYQARTRAQMVRKIKRTSVHTDA